MRKQGHRVLGLVASVLLVALALPGCSALSGLFRYVGVGGDDPKWIEKRYKAVSSTTVLQLANAVVNDRYPPSELDLYHGRMETGWVYGRFSELKHQALRQRVIVETEDEPDQVLLIRLRVQQETSESAGRTGDRDVSDWEPFDDDTHEATRLVTKLNILMKEVAEPMPAPENSGP
jgi:hypothetical protein